MRPVRAVCLYFLAIFLGAALAAPWLFKLLQWLASSVPVLNSLAGTPFPRCLNRTLMLVGIIGLWPLLRALNLRTWRDLGFGRGDRWAGEVLRGFLLGFASLGFAAIITLVFGVRALNPDHTAGEIVRHLLNAGSAAVAVSAIEETFFRGVLFGVLKRTWTWPVALFVSSAIYAALHFLQRIQFNGPVDWGSGFVALGLMLGGFGSAEQVFPGLITLTLAGIILGLGYQWTGSLYFPVGLHAGWIFWLKSYGFLTFERVSEPTWLWGSNRMIDGCLSLAILVGLLAFLAKTHSQLRHDDQNRP